MFRFGLAIRDGFLGLLTMMTWEEAVGGRLPGPLAIGSWEWTQKPDNTGLVIGGDLAKASTKTSSGPSPPGVASDMAEELLQENFDDGFGPRQKAVRSKRERHKRPRAVLAGDQDKIRTSREQDWLKGTGGSCVLSKSHIYDDISLALLEALAVGKGRQKSRLETIYTTSALKNREED